MSIKLKLHSEELFSMEQRRVQLKALNGAGGALPPCWPSAAAGTPSGASVPTLTPCTSYCGKAAETNQPEEQTQHGPLA